MPNISVRKAEVVETQALILRQMEFDAMRTLAEFDGRQEESPLIRNVCLRAEAILAYVEVRLSNENIMSRHDPMRKYLLKDRWNPDIAFDEKYRKEVKKNQL